MAAEWSLTPECADDISEAYAWYEDHRVGLGEEFLSRLDACIQLIVRHPEIHPVAHENYRRAMVRQFPYSVLFESTGDTVMIYGVFHVSRDPRKWQARIK